MCRRVHDNPEQARTSPVRETQLENAQMRPDVDDDDNDDDDALYASAHTPFLVSGSLVRISRRYVRTDVHVQVQEVKGSRTNQKVSTVNFFRHLYARRVLGLALPPGVAHAPNCNRLLFLNEVRSRKGEKGARAYCSRNV